MFEECFALYTNIIRKMKQMFMEIHRKYEKLDIKSP